MGNAEKVYGNICRICLCHDINGPLVSLTDRNTQDGLSCYGKSVVSFANISIETDDCLPYEMCINCLNLLKNAIRFKFLSESNDKRLRNIKLLTKMSDQFELDFKAKVIEYTTFTSYFPKEPLKGMASKKTVHAATSTNGTNVSYPEIEAESSFHEDLETMHSDEDISEEGKIILNRLDNLVNSSELLRTPTFFTSYFKKKALNEIATVKTTGTNGTDIKYPEFKAKSGFHEELDIMHSNEDISEDKKTILSKLDDLVNKNSSNTKFKRKYVISRNLMKNIKCSVCNKVLANPKTYEQHMQMHYGYDFMCEHCGRGFAAKESLHVHQVAKHGSDSHFQCEQCKFKAAKKNDLIEHIRIHTGERPFSCDKCDLTFRRRYIWKQHLVYHTEKTIQCPQCPRKFFTKRDMLVHTNSAHERKYVYLCSQCDVSYAKACTVRRHLAEKHGIPREMQGKVTRIVISKKS